MATGLYTSLGAIPPNSNISTASVSGEVGLWSTALYSPIPANGVQTPSAYEIFAAGRVTTAATPANCTITARIGTSTSGITLGGTGAIAFTASITDAYWELRGVLNLRTVGAAGTNSTAKGNFRFATTQGTSAGVAGPANVGTGWDVLFGNTSASYDSTVANGLFISATHTVTTVTWNVESIIWKAL